MLNKEASEYRSVPATLPTTKTQTGIMACPAQHISMSAQDSLPRLQQALPTNPYTTPPFLHASFPSQTPESSMHYLHRTIFIALSSHYYPRCTILALLSSLHYPRGTILIASAQLTPRSLRASTELPDGTLLAVGFSGNWTGTGCP